MAEQAKKQSSIKLRSVDLEVFEVDVDVARMSGLLRDMMDQLEDDGEEIPIQKVNSSILRKVIQWATYHKADPPAPENDEAPKRSDDISSWDAEFLKEFDQGSLFEIILAANYLDIKGLLAVSCKTVANMIRGMGPEDMRKTFNIKNDFTPSEEEQIKRENDWVEDK